LVERTGAGVLDGDTYGWTDLPAQDALERARDLYRAKESGGLRFALDLRPHDDHHWLLSLARTAPTESASIEIGGDVVCGFFTSWGDGAFPVRRDLAADGTLCRVRVELGAPEIVERQRKLDDLWFGELSRAALVSNRVAQDGAQVRWMYRKAPGNPHDSGWRVFSGDESDSEVDDAANIAIVPLRDLVAADASLEALFRTSAPCAFERDSDGDFVAVEYQPPQDLLLSLLSGRRSPLGRFQVLGRRPHGCRHPVARTCVGVAALPLERPPEPEPGVILNRVEFGHGTELGLSLAELRRVIVRARQQQPHRDAARLLSGERLKQPRCLRVVVHLEVHLRPLVLRHLGHPGPHRLTSPSGFQSCGKNVASNAKRPAVMPEF